MIQVNSWTPWCLEFLRKVNLIAGFWLPPVPALKVVVPLPANIYEIFSYLSTLPAVIGLFLNANISVEYIVYVGSSTSLLILPNLVSIYLRYQRHKLIKVLLDSQTLLRTSFLNQKQVLTATNSSCIIFLIGYGSYLVTIQLVGCTAMFLHFFNPHTPNTSQEILVDKFIFGDMKSSTLLKTFGLGLATPTILLNYVFVSFKFLGHNALIWVIFCMIKAQLRALRMTFKLSFKALGDSPFQKTSKSRGLENIRFQDWLKCQKRVALILKQFNSLTSPYVVLVMGCNTIGLCVAAFMSTKLSGEHIYLGMAAGFCSLFVIQTFIFCYVGEGLLNEGQQLSEAVCRSPWLRAHPKLVPGLTLVALDCRSNFVVRGGPFFTLSLEFFASVVGAILTYYIVLMQMK